jgi:putative colanic acid biosynthesis glycosyltransferase
MPEAEFMKLTIATVVRNDLAGLRKTLQSATRLMVGGKIEYWVIDGSGDSSIRDYLALQRQDIAWISEPDCGIYDAMNKALDRATGDYILFINAGDRLHSHFDPAEFFRRAQTSSHILLGRVVEVAGNDRYLRPGFGQEEAVFDAPPHQATFYPRAYYSQHRYLVEQKIGVDSTYTSVGIAQISATFVPATVAEFHVGGVSSTYGGWTKLQQRLAEAGSAKNKGKLWCKAVMWQILPRQLFYRILAAYNRYTRLKPGEELAGGGQVLHRAAEPSDP